MASQPPPPSDQAAADFKPSTWLAKFGCAFRGVWVGVRRYGLASYAVHLPVMLGVLAVGWAQGVTWGEWHTLLICITVVLTTEMVNSAIEALSRAVTQEYDTHIRDALDIASGAVFVASTGAATVGLLILFG